jgi:hypothetical protein
MNSYISIQTLSLKHRPTPNDPQQLAQQKWRSGIKAVTSKPMQASMKGLLHRNRLA